MNPPKSADELKAELQKKQEISARLAELEKQRAEIKERFRVEELPITNTLKELGLNVDSVWSLASRYNGNYDAALPILFEHFDKPYHPSIRQGIAAAFGTPGAKKYWDKLRQLYLQEPAAEHANGPKEALAASLSKLVDRKTLPDLIQLVQNKENGISRVLLLSPLRRRLKNKEIKELVDELANDSDLVYEIESWPRR